MPRCSICLLWALTLGCVPNGPAGGGSSAGSASATASAKPKSPPPARPLAAPSPSASVNPVRSASTPLGPTGYEDKFERPALGEAWRPTSPLWHIENGRLCARGARNHPVWLARTLPQNVRVEFDAVSDSPEGDLKAEFFGDGASASSATSYTNATSYLTIFGGWKNSFHVLARIDEHAPDRPELRLEPASTDPRTKPVIAGRSYHFKVERADGRTLSWSVDDVLLFRFADPNPLTGPGHDHFGFNDWDVPVCFDNVKIMPL